MSNKVRLVSVALMASACSGGSGNETTTNSGWLGMLTSNSAPTVITRQIRGHSGSNLAATIAVTDLDGDTTSLAKVSGPDWLSLTPNGQISGTPRAIDIGTFDLIVEVSDGVESTRASIAGSVIIDPVLQALMTGDCS